MLGDSGMGDESLEKAPGGQQCNQLPTTQVSCEIALSQQGL